MYEKNLPAHFGCVYETLSSNSHSIQCLICSKKILFGYVAKMNDKYICESCYVRILNSKILKVNAKGDIDD